MRHWETTLKVLPRYIEENHVFVARIRNEPAGFSGLVLESAGVASSSIKTDRETFSNLGMLTGHLEHLWVLPPFMRQGVGGALFRHAMNKARELGCVSVKIESDPFAEPFYLRMGCERTGELDYLLCGLERRVPVLGFNLASKSSGSSPPTP